jgi:hypothetical protein
MHKLVHACGQDRLELEQQRYLSLTALELLIEIIPSRAGDSTFEMRLVPHMMANFAVVSDATVTSTTIDEVLEIPLTTHIYHTCINQPLIDTAYVLGLWLRLRPVPNTKRFLIL